MAGHERPAAKLRRVLEAAQAQAKKVTVIGMGNELRGDDAVGNLIAADLVRKNSGLFFSFPAGIAIENSTQIVREQGTDVLIIIDAVEVDDPEAPSWDFYDPMALDTFCHTTHSLPLSLLVEIWRQEKPGLETHFIGIRPAPSLDFAPLSPTAEAARQEIVGIFSKKIGIISRLS